MITLHAQQIGKRYIRHWIFRKLEHTFRQGHPCAVTGPNGSGKSTLLKVLAGFQPLSEGKVMLKLNGQAVTEEKLFSYVSIAAPYLELVEDFSLAELLKFHFSFKKLSRCCSLQELAERMYLEDALHKPVKYFSSGMKQRLKLGLAFYTDAPLLLLDEPTSNLDKKGQEWYEKEIVMVLKQKLVLVASNQPTEYQFCTDELHIPDWKQK